LPFRGRIVYDGLFNAYRVYFGAGIRGDLKESYMAAKQNRRIIETLEPERAPPSKPRSARKPARDLRPVVDEVVSTANRLRGGQSPVQRPAFSLLKASARLAQAAVHDPEDVDALWVQWQRVHRALRRMETTLDRAEQ
jgi:transposase